MGALGLGFSFGLDCVERPPSAAAPAFDPNLNLLPDPGFDNAAIGTVSSANVNTDAASALRITFRNGSYTVAAVATLAPGTYRFKANVRPYQAVNGGNAESVKVTVAGTQSASQIVAGGTSTITPVQVDVVVSAVTNQNIVIAGANLSSKDLWDVLDAELKQIA